MKTGSVFGEHATWRDVDFEDLALELCRKENAPETWEWHVRHADRRTLPLTEDLVSLLVHHQNQQPEGYPYVFVPVARYDHIQKLRQQGKWKFSDSRLKVVNNFTRQFNHILDRASCKRGRFHDFRRTALTNWLASGMSGREVMVLAEHASFNTTHRFYLAVATDLVDRARVVSDQVLCQDLLRTLPTSPQNGKGRKS
jgi:integrase